MELVLKIYYLLQVAFLLLMVGCLILLVFLKLKVILSQFFMSKHTTVGKKVYEKKHGQVYKKITAVGSCTNKQVGMVS